MAQIAYRANLSSSIYPMTIADGGRTVIIPGPDNNFDRRVDPTGAQKDAGIPQALYLENVMPTVSGYQSVGYIAPSAAMASPAGATLVKVVESWTGGTSYGAGPSVPFKRVKVNLFFWSDGTFTTGTAGDKPVTIIAGAALTIGTGELDNLFSTAILGGIALLYHSSRRLFTVTGDETAIVLMDVTASMTPLGFFSANNIIGIIGSHNYLLAYNNETVFWSSTTTITDFVSSLASGAGSINPNNSDGDFVYGIENPQGFYLFSGKSTILGQYTGNARYPWKFTAVKGSSGICHPREVCVSGGADVEFVSLVETNKEFKVLSSNEITVPSPEFNQLTSQTSVQADFNYFTNTFTEKHLTTAIPQVKVFNNRYVFLSINESGDDVATEGQYEVIIVYDKQLNRFGRLKIKHTQVIILDKAVNTLNGFTYSSVGVVNAETETITYLNFDIYQKATLVDATYVDSQAVLLLGKFQYARSRFLKMEEVEVEGPQNTAVIPTPNFSVHLVPSLDGRNLGAAVTGFQKVLSGGLAQYLFHNTAQNQSVLIKGAFSLSTVQLKFTPAGGN